MTYEFITNSDPSPELCETLSKLFPENPFYRSAYVDYRRRLGFRPWLLAMLNNGQLESGCTAFSKKGFLRGSLEIPSVPVLKDAKKFWDGLLTFSKRQGFNELSVNSFASSSAQIPDFKGEFRKRIRSEYVLDLTHPNLWSDMRKGHLSNIKKSQKAGLEVRCVTDQEACRAHARLIEESMIRRKQRGEMVSTQIDSEQLFLILESGMGKLFQAMLNGSVISSNLILMADRGAYNQTQGTSPEGMNLGAAHYLIYEIGNILRKQMIKSFNLGGTDQVSSGLERFKNGFGAGTVKVELQAAEIFVGSKLLRLLTNLVS